MCSVQQTGVDAMDGWEVAADATQSHTLTIPEFYRDKRVFVTGATGFMGKILIEKLLRSCPDIAKIYILLRPKKGRGLDERLATLLGDVVFERLRTEQPGIIEAKIVAVAGDCSQLGLGLSADDRRTLQEEVHVIFHVAASVRFDDPLRDAVLLNTRGTREVALLALGSARLQVLVHVSTTFSNCWRTDVQERIYPAPADWRRMVQVAEDADPSALSLLSAKVLDSHPNTYTFSKALGEHAARDLCAGRLPLVIARPSIVISTLEEPVPGWLDNFNGPVGLLIACGKGIMRTSYQPPDIAADYVPVDMAIRTIVVASWDAALAARTDHAEVVHCSSSHHRWVTIGRLIKMGRTMAREIPLNDIVWVPKGYVTTSRLNAWVKTVLFQLVPAVVLDAVLRATGRKPILTRLQQRIYTACLTLRYFTFREWHFSTERMSQLEQRIPATDRAAWAYDTRHHDVEAFIKQCMLGSRRYLLKEPDETLPAARRRYVHMLWLDRAVTIATYVALLWLVHRLDLLSWLCAWILSLGPRHA